MQRSGTISTWNRNPAEEEAMGAAHAPIWRRMIDVSILDDLSQSTGSEAHIVGVELR